MKTGFTILFLLLNSFGFTQKTYSSVDGEWIVLKDSIHFQYSENCHGCAVGCRHGEGTYLISEKKLILRFRPSPTKKGRYLIKKDSSENKDSSYTILVQVFEDSIDSLGLPGASVFYKNGTKFNGSSTDLNGKCKLKIHSRLNPDTLFITWIGYDTLMIPIEKVNQTILAYPVNFGYEEIYNEVKKFKMRGRRKLIPVD